MKQNFEILGRYFLKMAPDVAATLLKSHRKKILFDYRDIQKISKVFSDYHKISFPETLKDFSTRDATELKVKFTALTIFAYDPEAMNYYLNKRMQRKLRSTIAEYLSINHCSVSRYLSQAKVYIKVYNDFEQDINNMFAILKLQHEG